mgnify:FL=1
MNRRITTRADDERELLFLKSAARHGIAEASRRFAMSKGAGCGLVRRIRSEDAKHPCQCRKKKNRNKRDIP